MPLNAKIDKALAPRLLLCLLKLEARAKTEVKEAGGFKEVTRMLESVPSNTKKSWYTSEIVLRKV